MCNVQKACYDQEGLLNKSAGERGATWVLDTIIDYSRSAVSHALH